MVHNASVGPVLHGSLLRWLNELTTAGIFTTDTALNITSWNRWLVRATGRTEPQVIGQPLFEIVPELLARGIDLYYQAALRGEGIILTHRFHGQLLTVSTSTGPMPQSARIAPLLQDDAVVGTVTMIEDVTERVSSEAELRRQIAALEEARQTAEAAVRVKDEFLATLSHELRTPLNAVMGWSRILQEGLLDPTTTAHALRVIDRNVEAQARLVDDLLDMSRIEAGKLRLEIGPVALERCAAEAINAVTPAANSRNITIEQRLRDVPTRITGDADRLQQVIWNLLANAVKFTPRGGTIVVTVEHEPGTARVIVRDTGKGISPEFLPYVFDRFSQANSSTNRVEGGLGLGLALARQLIEMHGGDIGVHSDGPGRGATFTITLPASDTPGASAPSASPIPPLTGLKVLLVEDAEDWAELLARALAERGARVNLATTAQQAVELAARDRPDVIVADIGLPGEDGYSMLRRLRADDTRGRVPAIAITAYAGDLHRDRALQAGFDAYRAKPVRPQDVAAAIAQLVNAS